MQITDSPFYRVTAKAIIFNSESQILLLKNHNGAWELPGGGWEHDEGYQDCLKREIREELGVEAVKIGEFICMYRGVNGRHGYHTLRIASSVALEHYDIKGGEDMTGHAFVGRAEFMTLDLTLAEGDVLDHIDEFWPAAT